MVGWCDMREALAEKLPDVDSRQLGRLTTVCCKHIEDVSELEGMQAADVFNWYGVGVRMLENFRRLGVVGELPEKEPKSDRRTLTCHMCGKNMAVGERVTVQMVYEPNAGSKSAKICRTCAAEVATVLGLPVRFRNSIHDSLSFEQVCPTCGGNNVEGDHVEIDGCMAYQPIVCLDCGCVYNEGYRYTSTWCDEKGEVE